MARQRSFKGSPKRVSQAGRTAPAYLPKDLAKRRYAGKEQFMKGFKASHKKYPQTITVYQIGLDLQSGVMQNLEDSIRHDSQIISSAVRNVGEKLAENFATQGRSQGKTWKKLKKATLAKRNQQGYYANTAPLIRTGALEQAVTRIPQDYNMTSAGLNRKYGPNPSIVRRSVRLSKSKSKFGVNTMGGDQRDEVGVIIRTKTSNTGRSYASMRIQGNSVINNTGGSSNNKNVPARPFWFITPKIAAYATFGIQNILNSYANGSAAALQQGVISKRRSAMVKRIAFDAGRAEKASASKRALRLINSEIEAREREKGIRGRIDFRRALESKRRREIEDPFELLTTSGRLSFSDVVRILQHRSGVKMSLRYARKEGAPLVHEMKVFRNGRMVKVEVPIGPAFIHEMDVARLERINTRQRRQWAAGKTEAQKRASPFVPMTMEEMHRASSETTAARLERINRTRIGKGQEPISLEQFVHERAAKVEIRSLTLLSRKVALTRATGAPYKRSWRRAVASFPDLNPSSILPYIMTGQLSDSASIASYAAEHLSSLRGRKMPYGTQISEQLVIMRAERARLEAAGAASVGYRYAADTPEGYQERMLAIAAPSGLLITDRSGKFWRTRAYGSRSTDYGGDRIDMRLWRHGVVTALLESAQESGLPVMHRFAQELLAHSVGTRLIENVYGRYAFKGVSTGDESTMRTQIPGIMSKRPGGKGFELIPFDPWTDAEIARNRYIQLTRTIDAIESIVQSQAEEASYIATERFIYHAVGMYRPRAKDRSFTSALSDIEQVIHQEWLRANEEASRIAGRPMVTPYYFSERRALSPGINYASPQIAALGLSDRPTVATSNKRFRINESGQAVAITRPHVDWYNKELGIFALDVETARAAGVFDYRGFTPDVVAMGRMNEEWWIAAREIVGEADAISKFDAHDAYRASFTRTDEETGLVRTNYWQWQTTGFKPGQAYYGSDLLAPIGDLNASIILSNIRKQRANIIIDVLAELERDAPELLAELSDADRQQIRGLRATRQYISTKEASQAEDARIASFRRQSATKRERMRDKI